MFLKFFLNFDVCSDLVVPQVSVKQVRNNKTAAEFNPEAAGS